MVVTFPNLEALEKHLLSEAGALNVYSSDMLVFEDGVFKPFEIMFNGDNDTVIPIDKDNFDTPLDIKAMQDRIWVRWMAQGAGASDRRGSRGIQKIHRKIKN